MFTDSYEQYYEDYSGLGRIKFKKFFKRAGITQPFKTIKKKVIPAAVGFTVGTMLPGVGIGKKLRRAIGIKSKKARKAFGLGRKVGTGAAIVAATVIAAPIVAPMVTGAASTVGGGIVSAGSGALALAKRGVWVVSNFFTKSGMAQDAAAAATQEIIAGKRPIPSELEEELVAEGDRMAKMGQVTQANLFGVGLSPTMLIIMLGAGALAFILYGRKGE